MTATVDSADGVDLDRALDRRASQLTALGTAAPKDVRQRGRWETWLDRISRSTSLPMKRSIPSVRA